MLYEYQKKKMPVKQRIALLLQEMQQTMLERSIDNVAMTGRLSLSPQIPDQMPYRLRNAAHCLDEQEAATEELISICVEHQEQLAAAQVAAAAAATTHPSTLGTHFLFHRARSSSHRSPGAHHPRSSSGTTASATTTTASTRTGSGPPQTPRTAALNHAVASGGLSSQIPSVRQESLSVSVVVPPSSGAGFRTPPAVARVSPTGSGLGSSSGGGGGGGGAARNHPLAPGDRLLVPFAPPSPARPHNSTLSCAPNTTSTTRCSGAIPPPQSAGGITRLSENMRRLSPGKPVASAEPLRAKPGDFITPRSSSGGGVVSSQSSVQSAGTSYYHSSVCLGLAVHRCISRGADIFFKSLRLQEEPPLHYFIRHGSLHAVSACMRLVQGDMDFTITDRLGRTALHLVCGSPSVLPIDEVETKATVSAGVLMLLVQRLQSHYLDEVQWDQKTYEGKDFATMAYECGKASLFWPIVQKEPFFFDATGLLPEEHRLVVEHVSLAARVPAAERTEGARAAQKPGERTTTATSAEAATHRSALVGTVEGGDVLGAIREQRERDLWWNPHTPLEMAKLLKARAKDFLSG